MAKRGKKGKFVKWFEELRKDDVSLVGGKAANLGELTYIGVPVPPGFAITAPAYKYFIDHNKLGDKIEEILRGIDINDIEGLKRGSAEIRGLIEGGEFPADLKEEIIDNYMILGERVGMEDPFVAVRSSATAEDLPGASFAGQQETFLDVKTVDNLLISVKRAFSSLFTPRAIAYREEKGFAHDKVYLSCVVQKMVNSKAAGVMFTMDPVTGDRDVVVIEGAWGLGEMIVQGSITPDNFMVSKKDFSIKKEIGRKEKMLTRSEKGEPIEKEVEPSLIEKPCLSDEDILKLAKYALKIEAHYGVPQDIEWALDKDTEEIYILQSRPETVWSAREGVKEERVKMREEGNIILRGLAASPGYVHGVAHIIEDVKDIDKFKEGEILVTRMTSPDWVPAIRRARAIITDEGGLTCHAAIVSRELGIPAIVGTREATKLIKTGQLITVDATRGVVYEGAVEREEEIEERREKEALPAIDMATLASLVTTGTRILCNLGVPEKAEEVAKLPVDGVGLMRVEFIITSYIGEHPLKLIEEGKEEKYIEKLAEGIAKVGSAFYPRPVVMRFSDFKTNEYRALKGGEKYEEEEANPMLGWRGASRYTDKKFEPAFRLELRALKRARDRGLKNIWAMVPFCRTVEEMERTVKIMEEEGLRRGKDFKVWLMCEIPSNVILVDKFSKFVDGFSIGSNDLTQLILGVDRDSEKLSELFDERDEAVLRAISYFIKKAHENGCTVSICGQAPSIYPEFCEFLVRNGIDSISVNPDAVISTRLHVAQVERKIALERGISSEKED
ncbi:MAG: phosphoenolpyruvate synthase [Candidatus Methanospirareceae archaeon]